MSVLLDGMFIKWRGRKIQEALVALQMANDPETLWQAYLKSAQSLIPLSNDVLFASPFLGTYPVFGRTASGYPRGESYWGRLGEIGGATFLMLERPDLKVARMSDHFDLALDRDRMLYEEFMVPEGWRYCVNSFFRGPNGVALGTVALNRTEEQGDFLDEEMAVLAEFHPHMEAALNRVFATQAARNTTLSLQSCLYALPVPFLILDWNFDITFLNLSAREALHLWHQGEEMARASNPTLTLPPDLQAAATQIRNSWEAAVREDNYTMFGETRVITHASNPGMQAAFRPVLPADGSAFEPGLVIQFHIPSSVHSETAQAMTAISLLTATEREVSRLAASGHDNQEIAERLSVSVNTIRTHLRAVFRKLGINNRSRLSPLHAALEATEASNHS